MTFESGKKHWNWKGGIHHHSGGYIKINCPEHPFSDCCGYIFQHRLVMEKKIGRYLRKDEFVHHINGIKTDNRPGNLQMFDSHSAHRLEHLKNRPTVCTVKNCFNKYRCKGLCKSHYDKYIRSKNLYNKIISFEYK